MWNIIICTLHLAIPFSMASTQDAFADSRPPLPAWAHELATRKVIDYFKPQFRRTELVEDSVRLSRFTRPTEISETIVRAKLNDVVNQFTEDGAPDSEVTLESLVLRSEIETLMETPGGKRAWKSFFRSDRFLLFSRTAAAGGMAFGTYLLLRKAGLSDLVSGIVIGSLATAIQAGPLGEILKAMTSWILNPTTEFLKVMNARYTAGAEARINNFLDKFKPEANVDIHKRAILRVANIQQDGMDFAGMSPQEQIDNWDKNLRMWVAVAKTYGQLNRDTHHHGRSLIVHTLNEEQGAAALIQALDHKLLTLENRAETRLLFQRSLLGDIERGHEMMDVFDHYQAAGDEIWKHPDWSQAQMHAQLAQIQELLEYLRRYGFSPRDIEDFERMRLDRTQTIATLITALTLNEVRSFKMAEANRNLEDEARELQRVIRKGLHLQEYVNQYRPLVQRQMRLMGYKNSEKCEQVIQNAS